MGRINGSDFDAATRSLAAQIDHTVLNPHASPSEISYACSEAMRFGYASVCVNPTYVAQAKSEVGDKIKISALIGHPFGLSLAAAKAYEAEVAVKEGAQEIDVVLAAGWLREGEYQKVSEEIEIVRRAVGPTILLKATLPFDLLTEDNKVAGTVLCLESSCDFIVAAGERVNFHDIALMYDITRGERGLKASGPIKEWKSVEMMLDTGLTRLGTFWGLTILRERQEQKRIQSERWD